jgi:hypothetical protein
MSIAEDTREALRARPFLHEALRAGVLNYTAAARVLDVGDEKAVAAALRRYESELSMELPGSARVTMKTGLGERDDESQALLSVGDSAFASGGGDLTAVTARGEITERGFSQVLSRCYAADIEVAAAGFTADSAIVLVEKRHGPDVLRLVEDIFV